MGAGEYLAGHVEGIVHEPIQVHESGVDITASEVYTVETPGRIDFGGDELEPAGVTTVETTLRNPDDEYGWWHLDGGTYLLKFNETVTGEETVLLRPRTELCERGAYHPTLPVTELGRVPMTVAVGGLRIKENARVSTLTLTP